MAKISISTVSLLHWILIFLNNAIAMESLDFKFLFSCFCSVISYVVRKQYVKSYKKKNRTRFETRTQREKFDFGWFLLLEML